MIIQKCEEFARERDLNEAENAPRRYAGERSAGQGMFAKREGKLIRREKINEK